MVSMLFSTLFLNCLQWKLNSFICKILLVPLGWYPSCLTHPSSPLIPNIYVYMGLIVKATIPRVPPISLWYMDAGWTSIYIVLLWDSPWPTHYLGSATCFWSSRSAHVVSAIKKEAQPHLDALRKVRKELQDSVDNSKVWWSMLFDESLKCESNSSKENATSICRCVSLISYLDSNV